VYLLSHLTHNNVHINTRQTGRSPFHSSQQRSSCAPARRRPFHSSQRQSINPNCSILDDAFSFGFGFMLSDLLRR
jgi:hypothetical protein